MTLPDEVVEAMARAAALDVSRNGERMVLDDPTRDRLWQVSGMKAFYCAQIRAALSALSAAGYAVVPRVATEDLLDDVARRASYTGPGSPVSVEEWTGSLYAMVREDARKDASRFWTAMLNAAENNTR